MGTRTLTAAIAVVLAVAAMSSTAGTIANYTGANSGNWNVGANWSTNPVVPLNSGSDTYDVAIQNLTVNFNVAVSSQIDSLSLSNARLNLNAGCNLGALVSAGFVSSTLYSYGGNFSAASVSTIGASDFYANNGATVDLPGVTSYTTNSSSNIGQFFEASGTSSAVRMEALTTLNLAGGTAGNFSFYAMNLTADSGGLVDLRNLTTINQAGGARSLRVTATGTGSVVDLSSWVPTDTVAKYISVSSGGTVLWGSPTQFQRGSLTLGATGSIDLSALTNFQRASLTVNGIRNVALPAIANIDQSDFYANSGATVDLPGVTSYTANSSSNIGQFFEASGTSSAVRMGALTTLNLAGGSAGNFSFYAMNLTADSGGLVDLHNLTTVNQAGGARSLRVTTSGTGSVVDLSSWVPTDTVANYISVSGGGTVLWGSPTQFQRGSLTLGATGSIDLSALTNFQRASLTVNGIRNVALPAIANIDQSDFYANSGATVDLPGVTSYTTNSSSNVGQFFEPSGTSSAVRMGALTTLNLPGGTAGNFSFYAMNLTADSGGLVDLRNLTTVNQAGGARSLRVTASGTGSIVDLSSLESTLTYNHYLRTSNDGEIILGGFGSPFEIDFQAMFNANSGELDVLYGGVLVESILPNNIGVWETYHIVLDDPGLPFGPGVGVGFLADGSGTNISLSDYAATPEPATLSLLALGGLAMIRRRRK